MQFADKTTLGQSAVLGILYVSFSSQYLPYSSEFSDDHTAYARFHMRTMPTLQGRWKHRKHRLYHRNCTRAPNTSWTAPVNYREGSGVCAASAQLLIDALRSRCGESSRRVLATPRVPRSMWAVSPKAHTSAFACTLTRSQLVYGGPLIVIGSDCRGPTDHVSLGAANMRRIVGHRRAYTPRISTNVS